AIAAATSRKRELVALTLAQTCAIRFMESVPDEEAHTSVDQRRWVWDKWQCHPCPSSHQAETAHNRYASRSVCDQAIACRPELSLPRTLKQRVRRCDIGHN